ncbi:hypothetical protein EJ06DRAFT_534712 [Trichodelitschia bisporula]|uniref:Xaa-Pro aminopeptidase n=1 Tax=Trichodelitschia bisporula TaxID=703511 RepID=A0A6G1HIU0_9PEZI|nr:hypothetical protein EJ06DRAFT_534712 [Trichodelitschia bisporula]
MSDDACAAFLPTGKYPGKAHAARVAEYIEKHGGDASGVLYLEGQTTKMIEDNDEACAFRQRRYFYYLTGCATPDCAYTYDMKSKKATLFIPPVNPEDVIWSGLPLSVTDALAVFDVDDVQTTDELNTHLASIAEKRTLHTIPTHFSSHVRADHLAVKEDLLKKGIEICRVIKDEYEVGLIKHANAVSTSAHVAVIRAARDSTTESELYGAFLQTCISKGCEHQAYHGIFASGTAAATLHYVRNDAPLKGKLNVLVDAGAESNCYAADITRVFPLSGRFTRESKAVYETVLRMQKECMAMIMPGVSWEAVHEHAHKVAIDGLLEMGILKGDRKEIFEARTSVAFFPHGLGHYLGMDTHDTGGNPDYADPDPMFKYLRVRGKLPAGSVVTVEPGIYFCEYIIEPYLKDPKHSKYISKAVLDRFWDVGGVRIEDDVLVTEDGFENLTTTPKEVSEIEELVCSGEAGIIR